MTLPLASPKQVWLIAARCTRVGLNRDDALAFCARVAGHPIATRKALTKDEASWVITALDTWHDTGADPTLTERSNA